MQQGFQGKLKFTSRTKIGGVKVTFMDFIFDTGCWLFDSCSFDSKQSSDKGKGSKKPKAVNSNRIKLWVWWFVKINLNLCSLLQRSEYKLHSKHTTLLINSLTTSSVYYMQKSSWNPMFLPCRYKIGKKRWLKALSNL